MIHFCRSSNRNLEAIFAVIYPSYGWITQAKMNFSTVVDDCIFSTQQKPEAWKCNCVHSFQRNTFLCFSNRLRYTKQYDLKTVLTNVSVLKMQMFIHSAHQLLSTVLWICFYDGIIWYYVFRGFDTVEQ